MRWDNIQNIDELLKKGASKHQIYCDMDGVLADFKGGFEALSGGISPEKYKNEYGEDEFWTFIAKNSSHFYLNLDFLPEGQKLWEYIKQYDPIILSSPAKTIKFCIEDKKKWIKKHLGKQVKAIFTSKKEEFAEKNDILIDDRQKHLKPWQDSDGIAIEFTTAEAVIIKLKEILE